MDHSTHRYFTPTWQTGSSIRCGRCRARLTGSSRPGSRGRRGGCATRSATSGTCRAPLAHAIVPDEPVAPRVPVGPSAGLLQIVLVAPADHRPDQRPQLLALVGQLILARLLCQHALLGQERQPFGQHRFGDAQVTVEVAESPYPVEGVAHDQQGPAFADDLQGPCDGTTLGGVFARQGHAVIIASCWFGHRTVYSIFVSSFTEPQDVCRREGSQLRTLRWA